jgi:hypothetical protein
MKKDELIEALQKIEGNPEVYMSAFVWKWVIIPSP